MTAVSRCPFYHTTTEAYLACLRELTSLPAPQVSPREMPTREILWHEFGVVVPDDEPIVTLSTARNETIRSYQEREFTLYHELTRDVRDWSARASKFWDRIANDDGTINSNYGAILFSDTNEHGYTPYEWAKKSLSNDTDTRQAFMTINSPQYQYDGNKDQPCTMHLQFFIRDGHLLCKTTMRSCDVVKGLVYDVPWFCHVMMMLAKDLDVPLGTYRHSCHSLHLYEKDVEIAKEMLGC